MEYKENEIVKLPSMYKTYGIIIALLIATFFAGYLYGSHGTVDGSRAAEIERDLLGAQELIRRGNERLNEVSALADTSLERVKSLEARNSRLEELIDEVASTNARGEERSRSGERLISEGERILQTARERSQQANR